MSATVNYLLGDTFSRENNNSHLFNDAAYLQYFIMQWLTGLKLLLLMYNIGTDKIVGLVQDCSASIANALEILQSYTQPPKWFHLDQFRFQLVIFTCQVPCSFPLETFWPVFLQYPLAICSYCAGSPAVLRPYPRGFYGVSCPSPGLYVAGPLHQCDPKWNIDSSGPFY